MVFRYNLSDIKQATEKVWQYGKVKKVWAFYGEMGAGKTTFIHALCETLHVISTISSPTYSIINEYISAGNEVIYHMDLFRLKDEEEALQAGVEDSINSGNLCLIEWPEKAPGILPLEYLRISIQVIDEQTREVVINWSYLKCFGGESKKIATFINLQYDTIIILNSCHL